MTEVSTLPEGIAVAVENRKEMKRGCSSDAWHLGVAFGLRSSTFTSTSKPRELSSLYLQLQFTRRSLRRSAIRVPPHSPNMSSRLGFRLFSRTPRSTLRCHFLQQNRNPISRRFQQTAAGPATAESAPSQQTVFQRIWTSEVGVKTVHFWSGRTLPVQSADKFLYEPTY